MLFKHQKKYPIGLSEYPNISVISSCQFSEISAEVIVKTLGRLNLRLLNHNGLAERISFSCRIPKHIYTRAVMHSVPSDSMRSRYQVFVY